MRGCGVTALIALGVKLFASAAILSAGEFSWPDKLGPTFDGHVAPADAAGLPTEWDEANGKNIAWKIALDGQGHSTPVIADGRLWFTAATEDGTKQYVYCVDAETGRVIHHRLVFENESPEPLGNPINTYASPSCVLAPDAVYVHFGTYGTARLDAATADIVWQRRDINCRHFRGPGSSPALAEGVLVLTFDGIDRQFSTGLDSATGRTLWETPRSTDYGDLDANGKPQADGDLRKAYCSPGVVEVEGRHQVVSVGSRAAFGYDLMTGAEIWTIEHGQFNAAARPLFFENMAIINTGSARAAFIALRLDRSTVGHALESHTVWRRDRGNSDMASPVIVDGRMFFITGQGIAYSIDARTGKEVWAKRVGGAFVASPVAANGLIYFFNEDGLSVVLRAGNEYEEVARNQLDEGLRASPAVAKGCLYLRTFGHLYKIAAAK